MAASSCSIGIHADSANSRVAGVCEPGMISLSTSSQVISALAMKLNMMVVTTMWLPRLACR
ncbi:hypothetical protein D3C85_1436140 [compost metagenome]